VRLSRSPPFRGITVFWRGLRSKPFAATDGAAPQSCRSARVVWSGDQTQQERRPNKNDGRSLVVYCSGMEGQIAQLRNCAIKPFSAVQGALLCSGLVSWASRSRRPRARYRRPVGRCWWSGQETSASMRALSRHRHPATLSLLRETWPCRPPASRRLLTQCHGHSGVQPPGQWSQHFWSAASRLPVSRRFSRLKPALRAKSYDHWPSDCPFVASSAG